MSELEDIFDKSRWSVEETRQWAREHRAKLDARSQVEKDQEWSSLMSDVLDLMYPVIDCYQGAIEARLQSVNYDWTSLAPEQKIAMFDQAVRDAAKRLPTQLASYLEQEARDRFESEHNPES